MKKDVSVYLSDILESLSKIQEYASNVNDADFYEDTKLQDAIYRRLEVIGEAVKNVPIDFREKHKSIPWRQIAAMRDVLIHEYDGVELDRVWQVVVEEVPQLKSKMLKIKEVANLPQFRK